MVYLGLVRADEYYGCDGVDGGAEGYAEGVGANEDKN